jgi:GNAT superfamily N-acetyltransferase
MGSRSGYIHEAVEVRRAQARDAAAISAILLEAFLEHRPQYTEEGFAATTPGRAEILKRIAEGPVWLAVKSGEIVGTVSAVLQDARTLYVRGMAVLPVARGQGIGFLLFKEIEGYAATHGCTRLSLSTTPFLHRAIRLYERLGFVRTNDGPHDLFGTPLFTMEKLV